MVSSPDPDLRDVFKILYADDDEDTWAWDEDDASDTADVDAVDVDLLSDSAKYTRKRFLDALDSLFDHAAKKQRIFTTPPSKPSSNLITSSTPIPQLPSPDTYAPFSPLPLLARLRTFDPALFPILPSPLDPFSLAKNGWIVERRNVVTCCGSHVSVEGIEEMRGGVRYEVVRRLGRSLDARRKADCLWRIRSSPDELLDALRRLLHPLLSSSLGLLAERLYLEAVDESIKWKSPVASSSITALQSHVQVYSKEPLTPLASAMALFGWYPYHPNAPNSHIDESAPIEKTEIVHCRICLRRVGLWAWKEREFDLRGEHLDWCPLAVEGWWDGSLLLVQNERREEVLEDPSTQAGVSTAPGETGLQKGWLTVSDRLEKKAWRK